jgi:ATP-dependent DNA helicase RecG
VMEYEGTPILLVHIPEQPVKPVHRRGKSVEETWVRSGGTTRKASRQEVGGLMLNSASPRWEDLRASSLLTLSDVQALLDLETVAKLLQRPLPEEPEGLTLWLNDEGITVPEGRGLYITNFGAIAAARKLDDFPALERKRIRVVRYRGTNKVDAIDELVGQRGYAVAFEGLIGHLRRVLPHSEVIEQSLRIEVAVYPEIALRELMANALIHQDFSISGSGPMVDIYDDRIEITNPGLLLPGKKPDRLIGATPESRNEKLASSFRRFRICEERGTGFQKIVREIELFGLPPLLLTPQENAFRVTLGAPCQFANMSADERIEACYQHAVLQFVSSQTLTNTTLRERFKLNEKSRNQITNLIGEAMGAGRIRRKDAGSGNKFAEYIPYWA